MSFPYLPLNYEQLNILEGTYRPSSVYATNPAEVQFWFRALYQRTMAAIEWTLPDTWNQDYFKYVLSMGGFISVFDTTEYGVVPQWCSLTGYGIYLEPKYCNVANAYFNRYDMLIGRDCALIKFAPDYRGIYDLLHHYAEKLALISASIDMNAFNSRLAYIIAARTKAGAESIKKVLDRIGAGEPAVVIDEKIFKGIAGGASADTEPWVEYSRDVKNSYIGTELWNEHRTILNEFDREVGIPSSGQDKKERRTVEEVTVTYADGECRLLTWLEAMRPGFEMVQKLFGIECGAEAHFKGITEDYTEEEQEVTPDERS